MKTIHAILALIFATLLVSAFSFAGEEPTIKRQIKINVDDGVEAVAIEADDLEVGESEQIFTESGKEVLLTRTEEGYQLEVDGKEIDLGLSHGEGHHAIFHMRGEGDGSRVVIRTMGGEEGHEYDYVHGDADHHWVQKGEDGEDVEIMIERFGAADHLLQSGVLDDLDEETRQNILDTLREAEPHARIHKKVIVKVAEEIHEEHDEQQ